MINTYNEFINENKGKEYKVFFTFNHNIYILNVQHTSSTITTTYLNKIENFISSNVKDNEHYDYNVELILNWSNFHKPYKTVKNKFLYKVPVYKKNENYNEFFINNGSIKSDFYFYMLIQPIKDYHIITFYKTQKEALYFLKDK